MKKDLLKLLTSSFITAEDLKEEAIDYNQLLQEIFLYETELNAFFDSIVPNQKAANIINYIYKQYIWMAVESYYDRSLEERVKGFGIATNLLVSAYLTKEETDKLNEYFKNLASLAMKAIKK